MSPIIVTIEGSDQGTFSIEFSRDVPTVTLRDSEREAPRVVTGSSGQEIAKKVIELCIACARAAP